MAGESVNVADVESVLRLRDEFSDVFQKFLGMAPDLGESMKAIGEAAGIMGTAVAAGVGVIALLGQHGSEINDVRNNFDRLAGSAQQATDILAAMRTGAKGTIDDFTLMKDATKLLSSGMEANSEDFKTLTAGALALSKDGFGTTEEMLQQLSVAMETGRARGEALRSLHIDLKSEEVNLSAAIGMTGEALSSTAKAEADRQAILEAIRQKVHDAADEETTFAEKMAASKAEIKNFVDAISVAVATSPVVNVAMDAISDAIHNAFGGNQVQLVDTITQYVNKFAIMVADLGIAGTQIATVLVAAFGVIKVAVLGVMTTIGDLVTGFSSIVAQAAQMATSLPGVGDKFQGVAGAATKFALSSQEVTAGLRAQTVEAESMITGHSALNQTIDKVAGAMMNVNDRMVEASEKGTDHNKILTEMAQRHADAAEAAKKHEAAIQKLIAAWIGDSVATETVIDAGKRAMTMHLTDVDVLDRVSASLDKLHSQHIKLPPDLEAWRQAIDHVQGSQAYLIGGMQTFAWQAIPDNTDHLNTMRGVLDDAHAALENLDSSVNEAHDGMSIMGDTLATVDIPLFEKMGKEVVPQATEAIKEATKETKSFAETVSGALDQALNQMPNLLVKAFTGGGGLSGALQAFGSKFGGDLGKSLEGGLGDTLTSTFGDTIGKAIGSFLPAIGGLIGPLLGKLFNLGGPSQAELQGRQVEASFEQQFGGFQQMMNAIGTAYAATGRSAQQAQSDVKALLDAEKQGGDAATQMVNKINQAFTDQTQDAQDLNAAVQRYKFSIDELGPTMQKQQLDQQAQQIMNDWRLLVGSGIDVATVDTHMASTMQDYLNTAKRTGVEVPAAMEPIIQKMIDQGDLTDDAGNKITDMKQLGVSFAESMTQGFDRVVDKLNELLTGLGIIPQKIAQIPTTIDISANVNYHASGDTGNGDVPTFGPEVFVPSPRPAIVGTHGGEYVLHKSTVDAMKGGGGAGNAEILSELRIMNAHLRGLPDATARATRDATLVGNA